jgi:hypothetical protein
MPFGIKIPEEALCIVIATNIHVYIGDPYEVRAFQKVCKAYPNIWQDQSPIDVPIEQQIKILFVEE